MRKIVETDTEVKIQRKLGAEEFINILKKHPRKRIIIPESIANQSRPITLLLEAFATAASGRVPEIKITGMGKEPRVIKEDWVDPFIRSLVGHEPDVEARLIVTLLETGSTPGGKGLPLSKLKREELDLLPDLKNAGIVEIDDALRVRLTKLGMHPARGAKRLFPGHFGK